MGVLDYYEHTGDKKYVRFIYPRVKQHMDFVISRLSERGLMEYNCGDWMFVDWSEGMDNLGTQSFNQLLLAAAFRSAERLSRLVGQESDAETYRSLFDETAELVERFFWNETLGCYICKLEDGIPDGKIRRQPNILAILLGFADEERKAKIKKNVFDNDEVPKITTPYMKFYELSAMCELGLYDEVLSEIRSYWGAMLGEGATTFWETFDPKQSGNEKYSMYGRKYGKSLCHAWGAAPIYLLGKYFIGLNPDSEGYDVFRLTPRLRGLPEFALDVPLKEGSLHLKFDGKTLFVRSEILPGRIPAEQISSVLPDDGKENGNFRILPNREYAVAFNFD